jgi:hypothetical protein
MSRNITEFLNSKSESVKLKAEKIELTVVSDMEKEMKLAAKELSSVDSFVAKARQPIEDAKSANRAAGVAANNALKMYASFASSAKELGIDVPSNVADIKARAEKVVTDFKTSQAKLIGISGQL